MKKLYCTHCGQKLVEVETGYYKETPATFNQETGKKNKRMQCTNLMCEEGCRYVGHDYGFMGLRNKCERCGHVHYDY